MKHNPAFLRLVDAVRGRVREIDLAGLDRLAPASFRLVDVREDHEWAAGHIPGAEHLGRGILERDAETRWPDPATPLVLYCGGGYRSALAAESLQQLGYTDVRSLAGGWRAWKAENRPMEVS
jgi:rhodanese-related sulfurtransferase